MTTTSYPTDLSDSQWQVTEAYVRDKRKRKYSFRTLLNAIFYLVKTGCQWRMLPRDYPAWQTVYYYFNRWKRDGTFEQIQQALVEKLRKKAGRKVEPAAAIIDAGKKVKGRKRHLVVDTLGLILAVVIQSASVQDSNGADEVIKWVTDSWRCIKTVFADGGYSGRLAERIKKAFSIDVHIIKRNETNKFRVLPKRWIAERTFAWLDTNRRNSKDYERLTESSQAMIFLASIRLMILNS